MKFGVVTLFPESVAALTDIGVIGRAIERGEVVVDTESPRGHAHDKHRTVDDRPFGGGPGMVMTPQPTLDAIQALKARLPPSKVIYLSPQGAVFDQAMAQRFSEMDSLILLCGRYEGIDERITERAVDEEVSLGDFVLSGGEVAAAAVIDAVARLVPGVLGHPESAVQDSFADDGLLDHPHYTRPELYDGMAVPSVLLSGDHKAIAMWRRQQALLRTSRRRPELIEESTLSEADKALLKKIEPTQG